MYECKFSEPRHTDTLGEIEICTLKDCRCSYIGIEKESCLDFILR